MKNSKFKFPEVIQQTPSCLKIINKDGQLINMNDKGLTLIEADDLESVMMADVYSLVHPDDRDGFIELNKRVCSGESVHHIFRIIGLKGTNRIMETYASPYELEDGSIGHIAITNDITISYKARSLNEKISSLRDSFFKHTENPAVFFNYLLEQLLEITDSEYGFVGEVNNGEDGLYLKTFAITDISWSEDTRKFYQEYKEQGLTFTNLETLFGHVMKTGELLIANDAPNHPKAAGTPSGHPDLNSFLGIPLFSSGKFIAMCGLANCPGGYQKEVINGLKPFFDAVGELISKFKLKKENEDKEKLLIETSERLELALEGCQLGIWDWNFVDNSVQFDRRWGEMLGIPYEELEMNLDTWKDRVHPDDIDSCYKDIGDYLEGKTKQYSNIHRMRHRDGHWVYILDQGKVAEYDNEGKAIRFTGTHLDITEQKEQELELIEARNEAILAERSKGQFLATMSHEIRTPLNGVLGMVELLNDTKLNNEQKEMIDSIKSSGDSLMGLLNDILDLSKIDSGKMSLEIKDFSLKKLFDDVVMLMSFKAKEKNIDLSLNFEARSNLVLKGDIVRLKQVLINLISNAIKFTSKGYVEIKADYSSSGELSFQVKDTGIGINPEDQKKLFSEFVQADSSTTRRFGGTGLGLSICKKLVDLMNGQISLESKEGEGSLFKVKVPIEKSTSTISEEQKNTTSFKSKNRIMVVEDNRTNQIIIARLLEKLGQEVVTANDGQEGVDIFKREHENIDLIFMDMQMPILDGVGATTAIRELELGKEVPIIAITANAFDSDRDHCLKAGMNQFLTKPIQKDKLLEVLSEFID